MSNPSQWPLPARGVRILTPDFMVRELRRHDIARGCFPTAMGYYPHAAGHHMARRQHDDHLLIFCTDGIGHIETGRSQRQLHRDQCLLLPAGTAHRYRADDAQPWTIYWCHFDGSLAIELTRLIDDNSEAAPQPLRAPAVLAGDFEELLTVRLTGYRMIHFLHAANLLRKILTALALEQRQFSAENNRSMNLAELENYMRAHLDRSLSLDELARMANLSKYHFSAKYRELTGYSPIKHFLHMKIEKACELLDGTEMSIAAIAAAVGYDDPLYFSRLFHKTTGYSPRSYRRNITEGTGAQIP